MQVNGIFSSGGDRGILERKYYRTVDIVFPIVHDFIDGVTGYTKSLRMTRVHVMYSFFSSTTMSGNWKQMWTVEELKAISAESCEYKEGSLNCILLCSRQGYTR